VKPVLVLRVDGELRSVWLLEIALRSRFAEEVARRKSRELDVGERITIERGEKTVSKSTGNNVWPFKVAFHDAPKRSALDILGEPEEAPAQADDAPF
jgi:hypothetical protein